MCAVAQIRQVLGHELVAQRQPHTFAGLELVVLNLFRNAHFPDMIVAREVHDGCV